MAIQQYKPGTGTSLSTAAAAAQRDPETVRKLLSGEIRESDSYRGGGAPASSTLTAAPAARAAQTVANQADLLGEGTFGTQQAPMSQAPVATQVTRPAFDPRVANIASGRLNGAAPSNYGLSLDPSTASEAYADQQAASRAMRERTGGVAGDIGRIAAYVGTGLANPIGTVAGGYLSEPLNAAINPVGYVTQSATDEALDRYMPGGSGNFGNNIIPGVAGTGGDVNTPSETAGGAMGLDGLFADPAAGLDKYAQRAQQLGAGARSDLAATTAQRETQGRDMFAQAQAAQGRTAAQTGMVDYGAPQTLSPTQQAAAGNFGSQQRVSAPTLAAARDAAMGSFGAEQRIQAAQAGPAAQAALGNFGAEQRFGAATVSPAALAQAQQAQAYQAQNQAGFLAGTAQGARDISDIDFGQSNESRAAMGDSLNRIRAYVDQGPGESAALAQLRQAQESNLGDALSLARSGRGNAAGNMKMALSENAATNAQTNLQAAQLRAEEADAWRGRQLQGLGLEQTGTQAVRAGDIESAVAQGQHAVSREQIAANVDVSRAGLEQGLAQFNAGAQNQASLTNAQLGTQTSIANAEQQNIGSRLQAQLSTDATIQQAALANARNVAMGQSGTQLNMANAEQQNLGARLNAQLASDAAIQQATLANARNVAMGQAGTQVNLQNAEQTNLNNRTQAQMALDAARSEAELANARNIAVGQAGTTASISNADNAAAAERMRAQLASELAIAQGNSTTNLSQANLEAQVRQGEANDRLTSEMTGYGLDSQRLGQDALTHGLDLERDYAGQASELAAEMAKARAMRQAALIGGGASIIEELIPG